jgi:hypothetical protein
MSEGIKQLVECLLNAPALLDSLKRDPEEFGAAFGIGQKELTAIKAGTQVLEKLLNRFCAAAPVQADNAAAIPLNIVPAGAAPHSGRLQWNGVNGREGSSVATVGVVSLATLVGALSVLGTVSVVALNRSRD